MNVLTALMLSLFGLQLQAAEKVEFVANKIHSLMVFVEAVSGSQTQPPSLKQLFDKSRFNNPASAKMIAQYQDLRPVLDRFIKFEDVPSDRNNGVSVRSLVWIQSAYAADLADYQSRVMGFMQYNEMSQFRKVLEYFSPIHETLLWNPYSKELDKKVAFFEQQSKAWKLDELFKKAKHFYNSEWPEDQKFRISLFPIPPDARRSTASSYGAFESVGVIIGEKGDEGRFGVIFHELCHSLYATQGVDFQRKMSKWFAESKSPYGKLAHVWMDEVFATILGNGWAYSKIAGELDKAEWYNEPTINTFSKAFYPEVLKYLEAGRAIDEKLIKSAIDTFQKKFPDSIKELEPILANLVLVTDGSFGSSRPFSQLLRNSYRIRGMNSSSPINHVDTLKAIKEADTSTVFVIANWRNTKQLDSFKIDFPSLVNQMGRAQQGRNLLGIFDIDGRKFIVSILKEPKGYEYLAEKLKSIKKIDRLNEFLDLDTI